MNNTHPTKRKKRPGPKPFPKTRKRTIRRTVLLNAKEDAAFASVASAAGFGDTPKWLRHLGLQEIKQRGG